MPQACAFPLTSLPLSSLCALRLASIPVFFLVCVIFIRFIMSTIVEMKEFGSRPRSASWIHRHGRAAAEPHSHPNHSTNASPEPSAIHFHNEHTEEQGLLGSPASNGSTEGDDSDEIVCRVKKYHWSPPAGSEQRVYEKHQGEGSQYLRDFILGVNDGIISTFLVVVGVVAGGGSARTALLSGISSAVAGAISMGLGEYIATKSQSQHTQHTRMFPFSLAFSPFSLHACVLKCGFQQFVDPHFFSCVARSPLRFGVPRDPMDIRALQYLGGCLPKAQHQQTTSFSRLLISLPSSSFFPGCCLRIALCLMLTVPFFCCMLCVCASLGTT